MDVLQKPGDRPYRTGKYIERGPNGEKIDDPRETTISPTDERLPGVSKEGNTWEWIRP